jgi:hypothetical protein
VIAEGHVFPGHEIHDQAKMLAVLGHMGDAARAAGLAVGIFAGQVKISRRSADRSRAARNAAQHLQQLGLPVARNPGNAQDLARADRQVDPRSRSTPDRRARAGRAPPAPACRAVAGALSTCSNTLRPTISSASCSGLVSAVLTVAVICRAASR